MKKMKSRAQVEREYPNAYIEKYRCPECGGILVTSFGMVCITVCTEEDCSYSDYDYDFN